MRPCSKASGHSINAAGDAVQSAKERADGSLGGDEFAVDVAVHVIALGFDESSDPLRKIAHGRSDRVEFVLHGHRVPTSSGSLILAGAYCNGL